LLSAEECAESMGQRGSYAAVKDAQTKPSKVACALGTGQRSSNYAVAMDAQITLWEEE